MANQQKYFIGPSLLSDIRSTIQRVDAIAPRTSGAAQEVRLQMLQQPMDGGSRLRVGKVSAANLEGGESLTTRWPVGTCRNVTIWERTGTNCVPTASSPTETIEAVANLSHDVAANSWVVIGQGTDGKWYLVDSGIEGSCRQTIGGEDITRWPGWNATKVQLLGHDASGCLKWFDGEECPT